jgi:hypothetical protein
LWQIAKVAAEKGKIADAVRIWKIKVNFDRRNLQSLDILAKTPAKESLIQFYTDLKKKDASLEFPDEALKMLQ